MTDTPAPASSPGPADSLLASRTGAVLCLALNRPERRNALNTLQLQKIAAALAAADGDAAIRAVVITGDAVAFAAGADLDEIADATPLSALTDQRLAAWAGIRAFSKPLLAAVEGWCLGGGLELALACDILIAADGASFGLPEVKVGIMPGAGGTQVLPRMIGKALAMKMALSGQTIGAAEAVAAGLAAEAVAKGDSLPRAMALAEAIALNAPVAVRLAKRSIQAAFATPLPEGLNYERSLFAVLQDTGGKREGIAAFREKRKAQFGED